MSDSSRTVLFLGSGNASRSIIAEALLRHHAAGRFVVASAGTHPTWRVHHLALEALVRHGVAIDGLRSKSWHAFAAASVPAPDVLVSVCDVAAGEALPVWATAPAVAHWAVRDPATAQGGELERRGAFVGVLHALERRVLRLAALPMATLSRAALEAELRAIGNE